MLAWIIIIMTNLTLTFGISAALLKSDNNSYQHQQRTTENRYPLKHWGLRISIFINSILYLAISLVRFHFWWSFSFSDRNERFHTVSPPWHLNLLCASTLKLEILPGTHLQQPSLSFCSRSYTYPACFENCLLLYHPSLVKPLLNLLPSHWPAAAQRQSPKFCQIFNCWWFEGICTQAHF